MTQPELPRRVFAGAAPTRALIEASAGTGKTYTIEHLVLERVLAGVPIAEILLVTFTEKAAAELRDRVRTRLTERAGRDPLARRALAAFDLATITTLHGFAQRALTWYSIHTPYPYEQELASLDQLLPEVVRELIRGPWYVDTMASSILLRWLSESSQKTLYDALHHCVESPSRLRFARELERLAAPLPALLKQPQIRAAFEAVLAQPPRKKGIQPQEHRPLVNRILEHSGRWQDCLLLLVLSDSKGLAAFLKECESTQDHLGASEREALQAWLDLARVAYDRRANFRHLAMMKLLPTVREALDVVKRRRHVITYSDMIQRLARSLSDPETGPQLIARLQARFRLGIIDEFQDTDPLQWEILKKIFLDRDDGSLVIVGDPKQAIYRFRGADILTYQAASRHLIAAGGTRYRLDTNYRCTADMVDAINHFFGGAGPQEIFTVQDVRYETPLACGNRALQLSPPVPPVVILGARFCPHLERDRWPFELAAQIAREIRDLTTAGMRLHQEGEPPRRLDYRDVFVLVQKHAEGRTIAGALREEGIPFSFYKRTTLFDGPEARGLLDVLEAVLKPGHPTLQNRAFVTPFFAMDVVGVATAGGVGRTHPAVQQLARWNELAREGKLELLLHELWMQSGARERLVADNSTRRDAVNLERIFGILRHQIQAGPTTAEALVSGLRTWVLKGSRDAESAQLLMEVTDPQENAVRILTMHNAKGLEAPVVFLYGGITKGASSPVHEYHSPAEGCRVNHVGTMTDKDPEKSCLEEEDLGDAQRLMYVAMTRAKALCYLQTVAEPLPDPETGVGPSGKDRFGGAKRTVLHRVAGLIEESAQVPRVAELFEFRIEERLCRDCSSEKTWNSPVQNPAPGARDLERAAEEVRSLLAEPDLPAGSFRVRAGRPVFSYSSLKKRSETTDETTVDPAADVAPEVSPTEPPPGVRTGLCVHELCETVDCADLRRYVTVDDWLDSPGKEAWIADALGRQALDAALWRRVGGMVFGAFMTPVELPDFHLSALAGCDRIARELEFRIPYDPSLAAGLESVLPHPPQEDGWVMGFFDAVLHLDGKIYLVDWKTDLLRDYDPETVASHVASHYALQARLYASALARMLAIASEEQWDSVYGGFLYVFVRGFGPGTGVIRIQTDWKDLTG